MQDYKTFTITLGSVIKEIKDKYMGLNLRTAASQYIDLQVAISRTTICDKQKLKAIAKIQVAALLYNAFSSTRIN